MDTDKIKVFGARVKVDSPAALAEIERAERVRSAPGASPCPPARAESVPGPCTVPQDKMKGKVDKIKAHPINVFINRQLIYNYAEQVRDVSLVVRLFDARSNASCGDALRRVCSSLRTPASPRSSTPTLTAPSASRRFWVRDRPCGVRGTPQISPH